MENLEVNMSWDEPGQGAPCKPVIRSIQPIPTYNAPALPNPPRTRMNQCTQRPIQSAIIIDEPNILTLELRAPYWVQ